VRIKRVAFPFPAKLFNNGKPVLSQSMKSLHAFELAILEREILVIEWQLAATRMVAE
jgi:hypothetical protein